MASQGSCGVVVDLFILWEFSWSVEGVEGVWSADGGGARCNWTQAVLIGCFRTVGFYEFLGISRASLGERFPHMDSLTNLGGRREGEGKLVSVGPVGRNR